MTSERLRTLHVGGHDRSLVVVQPEGRATSLLLVLHGSDSDAAGFRTLSGRTFDRLAAHGSVVAYPEAWGPSWNDARTGTRSTARELGIDDLAFLAAVVGDLREEHGVPPERVFAVGFSNGAQMVIRLVLQTPELVRGVALIGSNHAAPGNVLPEMAELDRHAPMPVLTVNGTADPIVPFQGGVASAPGSGSRGEVLSSFASAALFAARNGITAAPDVERLTGGLTPTRVTRWRQPGCLPVDFVAVGRGGHTVPNRDHSAPEELGPTARDLDAGELVRDFFGLVRSPPQPR